MKQLALFCVALATLAATATGAAAGSNESPGTISVSGDAEVRVTPDQVFLTLGVSADDMVLTEAKRMSDEKSTSLVAALQKAGVARKDIQSDYIRIDPRYTLEKTKHIFLGYFVDKTYVVTVRDIATFEAVLSAAIQSGAESVQGIQFITTELRKHRDVAREKAIQAAREKATNMAAALGRKIGRATAVGEHSSRWFSPYNSWGGARGSYNSQVVVQSPDPDIGDTGTLEPGKISVTASVSVTFELK